MHEDAMLTREQLFTEAAAIRKAIENSAEPAERTTLKKRYSELERLLKNARPAVTVAAASPKSTSINSGGDAKDIERVPCPVCSELIVSTAKKCRHCGEWFDEVERLKHSAPPPRVESSSSQASDPWRRPVQPKTVPTASFSMMRVVAVLGISVLVTGVGVWLFGGIPSSDAPLEREQRSVVDSFSDTVHEVRETIPSADSALTHGQRNAVRAAKDYLNYSGFSRQGLIDQLSSDYGSQFSVADSTFAVDYLNVDWNAQAVRSAKDYLNYSGFSCQGLIDQLSSDYGSQYTVSEATYGATQAGGC